MAPNTFAKVATSLGDEMLILSALSGQEALGRPFGYELELYGMSSEIELESVIGQPVTVQIELKEGTYRFIHGIATRFACVGGAGRYTRYAATLRPWTWHLTRTMDCRIFHDTTVPDLVKELLRNHGPLEVNISRSYRKWEYLVQYRESTFNFVSRLMEQEGLYYYFKHEDGKHTMCVCDSYGAHSKAEGYEEIPYFPPYPGEQRERDHIDGWRLSQEAQSGTFSMKDFDFTKPKAGLETRLKSPNNLTEHEVYDYPGEFDNMGDGEWYTRVWREQVTSEYETIEGTGNARGLTVGNLFKLTNFTRKDQNREYLVTGASFRLSVGDYESTHRTGRHPTFRVSFQALVSTTPFRPVRSTRKPQIPGPQTAIVVGNAPQGKPEPDEIYTDRYGRVKVRFHWQRPHKDSNDQEDDPNSCMVRVAQIWAGANWGAMFIPRIGHEVVVEFLEGDPDRPLITGRVYNADNMPPYTLPANKTQSGIKSRSTKEGNQNNFNELRFEDKKGEEEVYVQAEKDMNILVKNDESRKVKHDRFKSVSNNETTVIGVDRSEKVGNNETIEIGGWRNEQVKLDEMIAIHGNRVEDVTLTETVTVGLARLHTIGGADTLTVGGLHSVTVAGAQTLAVGGVQNFSVAGTQSFNVGGSQSHSVKGDVSVKSSGKYNLSVDKEAKEVYGATREQNVSKNDTLNVGKKLVINAADEIVLKAGGASITLKKNGEIVLSGKDITVKGSGKVKVNADSNLVMKGQRISEN